MNQLMVETEGKFTGLLELAANNDVKNFKRCIECDPSGIDEIGLWYGRQKGSKHMVLERKTPLMVSATYGSIDVLKLILTLSEVDVNRSCGINKSTALHCAASGGSVNAIDAVKVLLASGADPNLVDANGHRPADVIMVSPKFQDMKLTLLDLLITNGAVAEPDPRVSVATSNSHSPPLSPSPENKSPSYDSDSTSSPLSSKFNDITASTVFEKKEYPVDPSFPDIKNSMYSTDEFRMFSFKVRPCSRAYSHDWTECPFVHPGENARRRDPRKYHYSCVPCPDFRKGACRKGDMCEYAHGVFECWLHPAQYRTRLCKDGTNCNRRVCFFAHAQEELRPLYVSTGSALSSPRLGTLAGNAVDFAATMTLIPGFPSSVSVMPPSPFSQPMSPSANGISGIVWSQPSVPTLHLPGSNLQSSRLRSSLNARDIPADDFNLMPEIDVQQQQLLTELSCVSQQCMNTILNHSVCPKVLNPSNLDDLFTAGNSSPRYSDQTMAPAIFSPTHKSAIHNHFQQQQSISSPINTNFSPRNADHTLLQGPFGLLSSGRMSSQSMEPISPVNSRISMLAQRDKQLQQFQSLSSRELSAHSAVIVGSPSDSWSEWSSNRKPDWAVNADGFSTLRRSSSFEIGDNGEEPDLSWVRLLVKESPQEVKETLTTAAAGFSESPSVGASLNSQIEQIDRNVMGAWIEKMQFAPPTAEPR